MRTFYIFSCFLFVANAGHSQSCAPATAYDYLDINNVKARINNGGDMWWDLSNDAEYVVPKSGNVSSFFAGALWIGGLDDQGILHMAAGTYRQNGNDFFPGPLDANGEITEQACLDFDRIWKVNKSTIDSFVSGLFTTIPPSIKEWPGEGNPYLPFLPYHAMAPFIDVNGDLLYKPDDGDYPAIAGDQALWFVFNDAGNTHYETLSLPLGIEVQCLAYAFNGPVCLENTTLYHYRIENKSAVDYNNVYIGFWTDPDLGCYTDDYTGCDTASSLGIVYNMGEEDDASCMYNYGNNPPIAAIQILKGPAESNGAVHYMDHFMLYQNDFTEQGNPEDGGDYYHLLQSIYKDTIHLKNPDGFETNYAYPSDPTDPDGWSMCPNSQAMDLRIITSSGPVQLNAGEVQTFDIAVLWEDDVVYPCPPFEGIIDLADCVKDSFDNKVVFTGIKQVETAGLTSVFPNPVIQGMTIQFQLQHAEELQVFDISGRMLLSRNVQGERSVGIRTDRLAKGLYLYEVTYDDDTRQTGKLVIQ